MEIHHIPKTFWHSLSISVLIISSGLTYVAYNSSKVTIELANAKVTFNSEVTASTIALNSALNNAKLIKNDTVKKYDEVLARNVLLKQQIENLKQQVQMSKVSAFKPKDASSSKFNNLPSPYTLDYVQQFSSSSIPNYSLNEKFKNEPTPKPLSFKEFDQNVLEIEESIKALESLNIQMKLFQ